MAWEYFYGEWPTERFFGWRCVMCGEIIDPLILAHRMMRKAVLYGTKSEAKKNHGGGKARVEVPSP
jgi:hypothetical protein